MLIYLQEMLDGLIGYNMDYHFKSSIYVLRPWRRFFRLWIIVNHKSSAIKLVKKRYTSKHIFLSFLFKKFLVFFFYLKRLRQKQKVHICMFSIIDTYHIILYMYMNTICLVGEKLLYLHRETSVRTWWHTGLTLIPGQVNEISYMCIIIVLTPYLSRERCTLHRKLFVDGICVSHWSWRLVGVSCWRFKENFNISILI